MPVTSLLFAMLSLASAQSPVLLRRQIEAGSEDRYRLVTFSSQKISQGEKTMEEAAVETSLTLSVKVLEVQPDGRARVELRVSDVQAQIVGAPPMPPEPAKEVIATGLLSPRNEITDVPLDKLPMQDRVLVGGVLATLSQAPVFPETGVEVGKTWTQSFPPTAMFGNKELRLGFRFEGEQTQQGEALWAVSMKDRMPLDMDLGPVPGAKETAKLVGTVTRTGSALYDKRGRLVTLESELKNDFEVKSGKNGLKGLRTERTKLTLVPKTDVAKPAP